MFGQPVMDFIVRQGFVVVEAGAEKENVRQLPSP